MAQLQWNILPLATGGLQFPLTPGGGRTLKSTRTVIQRQQILHQTSWTLFYWRDGMRQRRASTAHGTRRAWALPCELEAADLAKHCQPKVTAAPVTSYLLCSARTKSKKLTVEKIQGRCLLSVWQSLATSLLLSLHTTGVHVCMYTYKQRLYATETKIWDSFKKLES